MHAGSGQYAAKKAKRDSRVFQRSLLGYAKAINIAMKQKEIDQKTFEYFRWKRMIASEREEMNGTRTQEMMNDPDIIKRDKSA